MARQRIINQRFQIRHAVVLSPPLESGVPLRLANSFSLYSPTRLPNRYASLRYLCSADQIFSRNCFLEVIAWPSRPDGSKLSGSFFASQNASPWTPEISPGAAFFDFPEFPNWAPGWHSRHELPAIRGNLQGGFHQPSAHSCART
jgi:hypothetical protein